MLDKWDTMTNDYGTTMVFVFCGKQGGDKWETNGGRGQMIVERHRFKSLSRIKVRDKLETKANHGGTAWF